MTDLYDAMLQCLCNAQKQLGEAGGSGISVMLIGSDKIVRHGSIAARSDELLEDVLLCAWDMLHKMNPDATPDAFAQAAYGTALRSETEGPVVLSILQDHAMNE